MSSANGINPVIDRLEHVLANKVIPAPYDRWGARLLSHLNKPVQVVVTGLRSSGKSALIEMMAAKPVIGHQLDVPVTELAYGESERALFEKSDGSVIAEGGLLKDCTCPVDAVMARQELPDEALRSHNFIEIGLRGSPDQKRAALEAVVARGDIIIWCSETFSDEEQSLWAEVPDHIKDHSFLVLTMADRQLMRGSLSGNIERLEPIVAEEFMGLFPVATIQGIVAQTSGDVLDNALWRSSGGEQLMGPVRRQIKQGRTADIDQAVVFLDRLALRAPGVQADALEPVPGAESGAEAHGEPSRSDEAAGEARSLVCEVSEKIVQARDDVGEVVNAELISKAVDLLQHQASRMLDDLDEADELDADSVLRGCSDVMSSLSELLNAGQPNDPALRELRDDVEEGEEMLMLFQLERGDEAALDAATLLLQIRKELIEKTAV